MVWEGRQGRGGQVGAMQTEQRREGTHSRLLQPTHLQLVVALFDPHDLLDVVGSER